MSLTLELAFLRSVKVGDVHYACHPGFAWRNRQCPMSPKWRCLFYGNKPHLFSMKEGWLSEGGKPKKVNLGNFWDASADPSSTWASKGRPKVRDQSGGSRE